MVHPPSGFDWTTNQAGSNLQAPVAIKPERRGVKVVDARDIGDTVALKSEYGFPLTLETPEMLSNAAEATVTFNMVLPLFTLTNEIVRRCKFNHRFVSKYICKP